jgi:hypothetical protein
MRELLVRYLMGELDGPELRQLEAQLRASAELRSELAYLRSCFQTADDDQDGPAGPPRGLAERTSERVNEYDGGDLNERSGSLLHRRSTSVTAFATDVDPPSGSLSWSFADFVVAAGVCLAVSMLLLPALSDSRDAVLRRGCQDNLRKWNVLLALNVQNNDSVYLPVGHFREGKNDIYVLQIASKRLASLDELKKMGSCPGKANNSIPSPQQSLLQMVAAPTPTLPVNSACSLQQDDAPQTLLDYAIDVGYEDEAGLHGRRIERSSYVPVMTDAPGSNSKGHISPNHPGIIHVLFQDGHVKLMRACARTVDWFTNDKGLKKAGCNQEDLVLLSTIQIRPRSEEVAP